MHYAQIETMNEKQLTQQLGQYLYNTIQEEWLSATMTLACINPHINDAGIAKRFICTAYFTCEYHPETNESIEDKALPISEYIQAVFEKLFINAQNKSGKTWAEGNFTINRRGSFKLSFIDNDGVID